MDATTFEELKRHTRERLNQLPEGAYEFELRLQILAMQLLAEGNPVAPDQLSQAWQMPKNQVKDILDLAAQRGTLQLDSSGNLKGAALSLNPSAFSLRMNDKTFYAWCAYDAIFAPAVINRAAVVESADPLTGEEIHLKVSADGIFDADPEDLTVTYIGLDANPAGGPEGLRCSSMQFFASRENAELWAADRPEIAILSAGQIFELVREFQIEPAHRMGLGSHD